eukprot:6176283-Pleurochrysis_carterae.AAC.2
MLVPVRMPRQVYVRSRAKAHARAQVRLRIHARRCQCKRCAQLLSVSTRCCVGLMTCSRMRHGAHPCKRARACCHSWCVRAGHEGISYVAPQEDCSARCLSLSGCMRMQTCSLLDATWRVLFQADANVRAQARMNCTLACTGAFEREGACVVRAHPRTYACAWIVGARFRALVRMPGCALVHH